MEEVEKVTEALKLVERYEEYLFRKAFGVLFIVLGILGPLTGYLISNAQPLANVLGINADALALFTTVIIWIIGCAIILRSFASATIVYQKKHKFSFRSDAPHIIAIILVWLVPFFLVKFAPERLMPVAWLWAAGISSVITYIIIRKTHGNYPELLLTGLALLITSLPIAVISDLALAESVSTVTFSVGFFIGGLYSTITATRALGKGRR